MEVRKPNVHLHSYIHKVWSLLMCSYTRAYCWNWRADRVLTCFTETIGIAILSPLFVEHFEVVFLQWWTPVKLPSIFKGHLPEPSLWAVIHFKNEFWPIDIAGQCLLHVPYASTHSQQSKLSASYCAPCYSRIEWGAVPLCHPSGTIQCLSCGHWRCTGLLTSMLIRST